MAENWLERTEKGATTKMFPRLSYGLTVMTSPVSDLISMKTVLREKKTKKKVHLLEGREFDFDAEIPISKGPTILS